MRRHIELLIGLFGLVELLCPRAVVAAATRLAYRTPDDLETREWVYTAARVEGAIFVLLALAGLYTSAGPTGDDEAAAAIEP
ncbi:hypothetical protein [Halopenitus persicus]|jgi:hypothetical protein|uniref:DUF6199 domain-containing protein n=1 Tax=Halopenitus persicus TaxID=1048396 RepID=A0A1H3DV67_9EURY|nr:hypothetical protein [Halopenitus persicus]QHS16387.1 hypothetical protein GWK26_04015 [haloarchaeon 3A1-DGR]SDX70237.1 hypothetical protein SAMN05216564_101160 [Halopenitus persicus]